MEYLLTYRGVRFHDITKNTKDYKIRKKKEEIKNGKEDDFKSSLLYVMSNGFYRCVMD